MSSQPIAVFDSGLGGLSVVRHLRKSMPNESIVYFGDTARVPYGTKSRRTVVHFGLENARFLMQFDPKLIAVACNTASALALDEIREAMPVPVVGVVEPGARAGDIRNSMLRQFARIWRELDPDRRDPRSLAMTPVEVVILASMIQLEARNLQEMPEIASVDLNRLKIGMKLQCCATIRHALGEVWDRALTKEDLSVDSPYNTYRVAGLPPGPIGNPGRDAIEAVLRPSLTTYLYYVYKGDQTHQFSETYKEHLEAVRRFRSNDPMAALTSEAAGNS